MINYFSLLLGGHFKYVHIKDNFQQEDMSNVMRYFNNTINDPSLTI